MKIFTIIISTLVLLAISHMSWSENPDVTQPAETQSMQVHMQEMMKDQDMKHQMKCMQQIGDDNNHKTHSEMMHQMEQMMDRMEAILSQIDAEHQTSAADR